MLSPGWDYKKRSPRFGVVINVENYGNIRCGVMSKDSEQYCRLKSGMSMMLGLQVRALLGGAPAAGLGACPAPCRTAGGPGKQGWPRAPGKSSV